MHQVSLLTSLLIVFCSLPNAYCDVVYSQPNDSLDNFDVVTQGALDLDQFTTTGLTGDFPVETFSVSENYQLETITFRGAYTINTDFELVQPNSPFDQAQGLWVMLYNTTTGENPIVPSAPGSPFLVYSFSTNRNQIESVGFHGGYHLYDYTMDFTGLALDRRMITPGEYIMHMGRVYQGPNNEPWETPGWEFGWVSGQGGDGFTDVWTLGDANDDFSVTGDRGFAITGSSVVPEPGSAGLLLILTTCCCRTSRRRVR